MDHRKEHAEDLKDAYVQTLMEENKPKEPGQSRDLTTPPGASIGPHTRTGYVDPSQV